MTADVVHLPVTSLLDIPASLRALADRVEAGAHGDIANAIIVGERENGTRVVFHYGEALRMSSVVGILTMAAHDCATPDDDA